MTHLLIPFTLIFCWSQLICCRAGPSQLKRAPLKPGSVSPRLEVPTHITRPPYADTGRMPEWDTRPQMHDAGGVEKMRAAGHLAARVLDYAGSLVRPGITTEEIDRAVHAMIIDAGAYPSPLNYGGFPKSVCTSVNECICHGIPDSRALQEGDILNIDVTVYLKGYHGDASGMFTVGQVSEAAQRLCKATTEALMAGISVCGPGVRFSAIGNAIQACPRNVPKPLSQASARATRSAAPVCVCQGGSYQLEEQLEKKLHCDQTCPEGAHPSVYRRDTWISCC
jgi:methionyl aminopeptidase